MKPDVGDFRVAFARIQHCRRAKQGQSFDPMAVLVTALHTCINPNLANTALADPSSVGRSVPAEPLIRL